MDHAVAQHHQPPIQPLNHTPPTQQPGPPQEKLDKPAAPPCPPPAQTKINNSTADHTVYRWNQAKAYTRGNGFDSDGVPNDELRAVILSAACRMIANPRGIELTESVGPQSVSFRGAFTGWTVAETFTLNRYRKRAE